MDKYYEKIKKRMMYKAVLTGILIPITIYVLIKYFKMDAPIDGSRILDFLGGLINGLRGGVVVAFVIYLLFSFARDVKAIKDEKILKELFITEHDERKLNIDKTASKISFNIILYIIIVVALVCGLYNTTISLTLFSVWIFIVMTRVIITIIYSKKM